MNKLLLKLLSLFTYLFLLLSCQNAYVLKTLSNVETYISEYPDSALTVLNSIDRSSLITEKHKAYHALLSIMALDKTFVDVADDSLSRVALEYYSKQGPKKYEARALYYMGLSHYYAENYDQAILEFTKAEDVARISDSLYLGFVKVAQADTYAKTYNSIEEISCLEEAFRVYSQIQESYYMHNTIMRLAYANSNAGNYEASDSLFRLVVDSNNVAKLISQVALPGYAFLNVIRHQPNYELASKLYQRCIDENNGIYLSQKDCWAWALALEKTGDTFASQEIIKYNTTQTEEYAYWNYLLSKHKNEYTMALSFLEKAVQNEYKSVEMSLKQSLALAQRGYYESKFRETSMLVELRNYAIFTIISLVSLLSVLILWIIYAYMQKQKKEKERLVEYAEEIRRQLDQYEKKDYPLLKKKFIALYRSRFESIGTLCEQYLQNQGRDDLEKIMYNRVVVMIEDIRNDTARRKKFEALLDSELDGIMTNFRAEMPKCREWEITMFSYLVAGFDATTISRLLDIPLNNVYSYKHRLKLKIEGKRPEHYSQFLEMIS